MKLVITGWEPGFLWVGMINWLKDNCGMDLMSAKAVADEVLHGQRVELVVPDDMAPRAISELAAMNLAVEAESEFD